MARSSRPAGKSAANSASSFIKSLTSLSQIRQELKGTATLAPFAIDAADDRAWGLYAELLRRFVTGGDPSKEVPGLHLVVPPLPADWHVSETGDYYVMKVLADNIPRWYENYLPRNISFSETYGLFVQSIKLPAIDEEKANEAVEHLEKLGSLGSEYSRRRRAAMEDWKLTEESQESLPPNDRTTFREWWNDVGKYYVAAVSEEMTRVRQEYIRAHNAAYRGYENIGEAIAKYYEPDEGLVRQNVRTSSGLMESVYVYNVSPDLKQFVASGRTNLKEDSWPLNLDVSHTDEAYDYSRTWRSGGVSWDSGFVSVGARGSSEKVAIDSRWDNFRMALKARNVAWFNLVPGPWFSSRAIIDFSKGEFQAESWAEKKSAAGQLFGVDGDFNLLPVQLLVFYQPALLLRVESGQYTQIREKWRVRGGGRIGPFRIGGSGGGEKVEIRFNNDTGSIEINHVGDDPVILAVRSALLPNFQ